MSMPNPFPKYVRGALLGLAIAESLTQTPHPLPDPSEALPGAGLWHDGVAMTLLLAESLHKCAGIDPQDHLLQYGSWLRYGYQTATDICEEVPTSIRQAVERFERTWEVLDPDRNDGVCCLCRLIPVAAQAPTPEAAETMGRDTTRTTHTGANTLDAAAQISSFLWHCFHDQTRPEIFFPAPTNSFQERPWGTVQAAFHTLQTQPDFFSGLAILSTSDSLPLYGQLAGAFYGEDALPQWKTQLARPDILEHALDQLLTPLSRQKS